MRVTVYDKEMNKLFKKKVSNAFSKDGLFHVTIQRRKTEQIISFPYENIGKIEAVVPTEIQSQLESEKINDVVRRIGF